MLSIAAHSTYDRPMCRARSALRASRRPLELESRGGDADKPPEHSREVARIFKTGLHAGLQNSAFWIAQRLFGSFDPLQQHIAMRRTAHALSEQLGEVVWTQPRQRSELRQAEILFEIGCDVVEHTLESICR